MSWAIWITGPPGSGKSTLARAAAAALRAARVPVHVLELDEIRKTLTPHPTYSDAERDVVYRALAGMATLLTEVGVPVIVDATASRRLWRNLARAAIPHFAEVQLLCPLKICRERERTRPVGHAPRDIYSRAGQPGATVPGIDVPYEAALDPELVIDTAQENLADATARVVALARSLGPVPRDQVDRAGDGWAIWITGRPGSGKTTLAARLVEALAARGISVKVLDLSTVRRFLLGESPVAESYQELVYRVLVHIAKLLTEVGVAVIVDATASRRGWREAAREQIPRFAEVQLVCPVEICVERERAARWGLDAEPCHHSAEHVRAAAPDIEMDYEESFTPELVIHTHIHDPWSAVEQVLFLVHRLRQPAAGRLAQS